MYEDDRRQGAEKGEEQRDRGVKVVTTESSWKNAKRRHCNLNRGHRITWLFFFSFFHRIISILCLHFANRTVAPQIIPILCEFASCSSKCFDLIPIGQLVLELFPFGSDQPVRSLISSTILVTFLLFRGVILQHKDVREAHARTNDHGRRTKLRRLT